VFFQPGPAENGNQPKDAFAGFRDAVEPRVFSPAAARFFARFAR
jgi:hypothetical protein